MISPECWNKAVSQFVKDELLLPPYWGHFIRSKIKLVFNKLIYCFVSALGIYHIMDTNKVINPVNYLMLVLEFTCFWNKKWFPNHVAVLEAACSWFLHTNAALDLLTIWVLQVIYNLDKLVFRNYFRCRFLFTCKLTQILRYVPCGNLQTPLKPCYSSVQLKQCVNKMLLNLEVFLNP